MSKCVSTFFFTQYNLGLAWPGLDGVATKHQLSTANIYWQMEGSNEKERKNECVFSAYACTLFISFGPRFDQQVVRSIEDRPGQQEWLRIGSESSMSDGGALCCPVQQFYRPRFANVVWASI